MPRKQQITPVANQKPESEFNKTQIPPEIQIVKIAEYRNILFQYRSAKAKSVAIIGDFNNWTPQEFKKVSEKDWQITLKLQPGKYLYNYLVNGKVKLDPNNLKPPVENRSRGFMS